MRHPAFAFVVLLAAVTGPGAEPDAPLAGTREELRKFRTDQSGRTETDSREGLKGGLPALTLPSGSAPVYQRPAPEQQDSQSRSASAQNWLLNGVKRLERESAAKSGKTDRTEQDSTETDPIVLDPNDPDFLLKLYERQKQAAELKADKAQAPAPTRPDAFAPFLQDWMAASPVKDQLLKNMGQPGATGSPVDGNSPPSLIPTADNRPAGDGPFVFQPFQADAAPANPYLTAEHGVGSGAPKEAALSPGLSLGGPDTPAAAWPVNGPLYLPVPAPAPPVRNAPPVPLADDKKYFPQLKKF